MFVPGLQLSHAFYAEAVRPLLADIRHSAARMGTGSEVLGFDTPRSADHEWGPRLQVFLSPADAGRIPELDRRLAERLPHTFHGWSTHFEIVQDDHIGRMAPTDGPIRHRVTFGTVDRWLGWLGIDPHAAQHPENGWSPEVWLGLATQTLAESTGGAVFHDGLGTLEPARAALRWYPTDLWRHVLAGQWRRIAQEEAFVGRAGEVGDELGSAVVAARLVRDLMRLSLLLHRRYPPYSKWLGSAFAALPVADTLGPVLRSALAATDWHDRERHLATAYETLTAVQNDTGLAAAVDPGTRPYFGRPFRVLRADRVVDALRTAITDPSIAALPLLGAIDQHADNTDLLTDPARCRAVARAVLRSG